MTDRVKFSVAREDAELEKELAQRTQAQAALVVASGGCTALSLAHWFPRLHVAAFDPNAAQLAHVRKKAEAAADQDLQALNVGDQDPAGLNQSGHFEGLFRVLRNFIEEFVAPPQELHAFFDPFGRRRAACESWFASPYWPAAFAAAFADPVLEAMFGPAAAQHAPKGSSPGYFQRTFERGLRQEGAARNPFLQHVLLGAYLPADAPAYVHARSAPQLELIAGGLEAVPDLSRFGLVSLSNILDGSDDVLAARIGAALAAARPGTALLLRQLGNRRDLRRFFAPAFRFDDALSAELLARDRSLVYERIEVGFRT